MAHKIILKRFLAHKMGLAHDLCVEELNRCKSKKEVLEIEDRVRFMIRIIGVEKKRKIRVESFAEIKYIEQWNCAAEILKLVGYEMEHGEWIRKEDEDREAVELVMQDLKQVLDLVEHRIKDLEEERESGARTKCRNPACKFYGDKETNGYCSVCFKEHKSQQILDKKSTFSWKSKWTRARIRLISLIRWIILVRSQGRKHPLDDMHCYECSKKISLAASEISCKCGHRFCRRHRAPENHHCHFDFKHFGRLQLLRQNPSLEGKKLDRI